MINPIKTLDFYPGIIAYEDFDLDLSIPLDNENLGLSEDMLRVNYPNEIILDVGWIHGVAGFIIQIVQGNEPKIWNRPLFIRRCKTIQELKIILQQCITYIRLLFTQKILGDIDFFPGSISLDLFDFDPIIPLDNTNPYLQEEMFEVMYDQDMQIQVQWQKEPSTFMVAITQGKYPENLNNVLQQKECKTLEAIKETLKEYVAIIQEKLNSSEE